MSFQSYNEGAEDALHKIAAHLDQGTAPGTLYQACEQELDRELEKKAFDENPDAVDQRLGVESVVSEFMGKVAMLAGLNEVNEQTAPKIMKVAFDQTVDSHVNNKQEVLEKVARLQKEANFPPMQNFGGMGQGVPAQNASSAQKNDFAQRAAEAVKSMGGDGTGDGSTAMAPRTEGDHQRSLLHALSSGAADDAVMDTSGYEGGEMPSAQKGLGEKLKGMAGDAAGWAGENKGKAGLAAALTAGTLYGGHKLNQRRKAKQEEEQQQQQQQQRKAASQQGGDDEQLSKLAEAIELLRPYNVIDEEALNRL